MAMRSLWPFAPAFFVFAGAILVAIGGFWASWRQSNFNAEIKEKNEEIARLQRENANAITGGDSFCWMGLSVPDPGTAAVAIPIFIHQGKYPLYDVAARIVDLDEYARLKAAKEGIAASNALLGTAVPVGNMTPGFSTDTGIRLSHPSGKNFTYNVFYVARNGSWIQMLRMRWTGNGWTLATKVQGLTHQDKELYREVSPDYPLNAHGDVDWDEGDKLPSSEPEKQTK
jgi:hypothetical protein